MKHAVATTLALVGSAFCQTPQGWGPQTDKQLGVMFGNVTVSPNETISSTDVLVQPTLYSAVRSSRIKSPHHAARQAADAKYMVILLDLEIPDSDFATPDEYASLVPGLIANTTTRLHWWGTNLTLDAASGVYVDANSSADLSPFGPPAPRDATYHTYAFYLFDQPASYVPSAEALAGDYVGIAAEARFNFSLTAIVDEVGGPVAANYFRANDE